jgi:RNA polymerase sigma factor for flagellar operon FliA
MNQKNSTEGELLKQHTPLVSSVVRQFADRLPELLSADHLHGLGLIALLDAARRYPSSSRVSFETFARIQIHGALLGEIRRAKNWFPGVTPAATPTPAFA